VTLIGRTGIERYFGKVNGSAELPPMREGEHSLLSWLVGAGNISKLRSAVLTVAGACVVETLARSKWGGRNEITDARSRRAVPPGYYSW